MAKVKVTFECTQGDTREVTTREGEWQHGFDLTAREYVTFEGVEGLAKITHVIWPVEAGGMAVVVRCHMA